MTDLLDVQDLPTITLRREGGIEISLLALGARITGLMAPDRTGTLADVVLGHDRPEDYLTVGGYLGATCGRYAGSRMAGFPLMAVKATLTGTKVRSSCMADATVLTERSGGSPAFRQRM